MPNNASRVNTISLFILFSPVDVCLITTARISPTRCLPPNDSSATPEQWRGPRRRVCQRHHEAFHTPRSEPCRAAKQRRPKSRLQSSPARSSRRDKHELPWSGERARLGCSGVRTRTLHGRVEFCRRFVRPARPGATRGASKYSRGGCAPRAGCFGSIRARSSLWTGNRGLPSDEQSFLPPELCPVVARKESVHSFALRPAQ